MNITMISKGLICFLGTCSFAPPYRPTEHASFSTPQQKRVGQTDKPE